MMHKDYACSAIDKLLRNKAAWYLLLIIYVGLLLLTVYKDLYFTGNKPSPLFYFTVPTTSIICSAVIVYLVSKLVRNPLPFGMTLKIILVSEIVLQVWENCAKAIYYLVWEYPGMLWFISFPVALCLMAYLFVCANRTGWRYGLLFSAVSLAAGIASGMIFMALTGIDTPGS